MATNKSKIEKSLGDTLRQPGGEPVSAEDFANYLAPMLLDLSRIASRNGWGHLAYLLDMARLEASSLTENDVKKSA